MKIKVSEATGKVLDYMVATAEGVNDEAFHLYYEPTEPTDYDSHGYPEFHYSTVWAQGGPIIERDRIDCISDPNGSAGWLGRNYINQKIIALYGPTPLVAAMRCYVASKLGYEIDVPEELK